VYEVIEYSTIEIQCEYNIKDRVLFFFDKNNIKYSANYSEKVGFEVNIPKSDEEKFIEDIVKLTENKIFYNVLSKE